MPCSFANGIQTDDMCEPMGGAGIMAMAADQNTVIDGCVLTRADPC